MNLISIRLRKLAEDKAVRMDSELRSTIEEAAAALERHTLNAIARECAASETPATDFVCLKEPRCKAPCGGRNCHVEPSACSAERVATGQPGRIPELEQTRMNADYWLDHARGCKTTSNAVIHAEQAISAWKNAAYAAWDRIKSSAPSSDGVALAEAQAHSLKMADRFGALVAEVSKQAPAALAVAIFAAAKTSAPSAKERTYLDGIEDSISYLGGCTFGLREAPTVEAVLSLLKAFREQDGYSKWPKATAPDSRSRP